MQKDSHLAEVGKRKIELSNLKKVLYPIDHILKAELIEYNLKIAPTILAHIIGRPLTLVHYPDDYYCCERTLLNGALPGILDPHSVHLIIKQ